MTSIKVTNAELIQHYERQCAHLHEIILSRIAEIQYALQIAGQKMRMHNDTPSSDGIIGSAGAALERDCARYAQLREIVETFKKINKEAPIDQS